MSKHRIVKTWGTDLGFSCAFRQWRATSHCQFMHGYALGFRIMLEADKLTPEGWVFDFGGFKPVKDLLVSGFDHKTVVAGDDPMLGVFQTLHKTRVIDLRVMQSVGCEAFAAWLAWFMQQELNQFADNLHRGVRIVQTECFEHGANSAIFIPGA